MGAGIGMGHRLLAIVFRCWQKQIWTIGPRSLITSYLHGDAEIRGRHPLGGGKTCAVQGSADAVPIQAGMETCSLAGHWG